MKKFCKDIVIGFVIFSLLWLIIEICFAHIYESSYTYKYQYMQEHCADVKLLLMGNSHMENSVDPHYLGDSVFNLAISGRWIYYDVALLQRYLPRMHNLKTVIFPMGYTMPYSSYHNHPIKKGLQSQYIYSYATQMHILYDVFPDMLFRGSALLSGIDIFPNYIPQSDSIGYDACFGQEQEWKNIHNVSKTIVEDDLSLEKDTMECRQYLEQMAALCWQHDVRFIVITAPCHEVYLLNISKKGLQIQKDIIERVQNKYPFEYRNYLFDEEYRADSIYYNCSHLNSIGAEIFAKRLRKDLQLD